jgi:CO/xanthine dehydrogenase Mo-binding subunit
MSATANTTLLDRIFAGGEQINPEEMHRRAVIADLPPSLVKAIDELPEGLYGLEDAQEALSPGQGVDPAELSEEDLIREMESLGQTRADTIQHGSWPALARHTTRMMELENEYLRRHPERDIDERRTREGARR